jgi:hypothetical protein
MGLIAKLLAIFGLSGRAAMAQPDDQVDSEALQRLRSAIPFRIITVPGRDALSEWQRLRTAGEGWPVVVGDDAALEMVAEVLGFNSEDGSGSVETILAAADGIDVPKALRRGFEDEYGEDPIEIETGPWPTPGSIAPLALTVAEDIRTGAPLARVHIVLVPTDDPAAVPAFLRWGGWNACPGPEMHVAVLRRWRHAYGAEVVGMSGDVINLKVKRRPASRDEAMALAFEQYLYCPDIVLQGTNTFEPLAAALMESDWWYFWWD